MKKLALLALCTIMVCAMTAVVLAGKNGPKGNANVGHLYLYEKDPATWEIVPDGAWGKMKYNLSGSEFDFAFNGHGLEAAWDYTLVGH